MCAHLGGNFDPICLKHNHNIETPEDEVTEFLPFDKCRPTWALRFTDETWAIPIGRTATKPTGDSIIISPRA